MTNDVATHLGRLRRAVALALAAVGLLTLVASLVEPPERLRLVQGGSLAWALVGLAVLNLVTVMPTYRSMLVGARRVFTVDHDVAPLLAAQRFAHSVAAARVAALALLGLATFLLTGDRLHLWAMAAVAAVGCALLWPRPAEVEELLGR